MYQLMMTCSQLLDNDNATVQLMWFQEYWDLIDWWKYETGIDSEDVLNLVEDNIERIIEFANNYLERMN